jgi:hypothetical protein
VSSLVHFLLPISKEASPASILGRIWCDVSSRTCLARVHVDKSTLCLLTSICVRSSTTLAATLPLPLFRLTSLRARAGAAPLLFVLGGGFLFFGRKSSTLSSLTTRIYTGAYQCSYTLLRVCAGAAPSLFVLRDNFRSLGENLRVLSQTTSHVSTAPRLSWRDQISNRCIGGSRSFNDADGQILTPAALAIAKWQHNPRDQTDSRKSLLVNSTDARTASPRVIVIRITVVALMRHERTANTFPLIDRKIPAM